jgi:thiamine biosynthesis lipoprotein
MVGFFPVVPQLAERVRTLLRPAARQRLPRCYQFRYERVLGTSLELRVYAETSRDAEQAEAAVLAEIDRLEAVFSSFSSTSELSRWQRTYRTPERLSSELLEVLTTAEQWRATTDNAFHPGSEELTRLWKRSAEASREPSTEELEATLARLTQPLWRIDQEAGTVTRLSECAITLNAIAKGYIVDRACEQALATGSVQRVLLNVGGDLRVSGHDEAAGELIGIADPRHDAENAPFASQVRVQNGAVASSGSARRGLQIGDRWYSHVFDPRTSQPVERVPGASVLAPTAMEADVLATAFSVLTPDESVALADSLPNVACILMTDDGTVHRSRHWVELELPSATQ